MIEQLGVHLVASQGQSTTITCLIKEETLINPMLRFSKPSRLYCEKAMDQNHRGLAGEQLLAVPTAETTK